MHIRFGPGPGRTAKVAVRGRSDIPPAAPHTETIKCGSLKGEVAISEKPTGYTYFSKHRNSFRPPWINSRGPTTGIPSRPSASTTAGRSNSLPPRTSSRWIPTRMSPAWVLTSPTHPSRLPSRKRSGGHQPRQTPPRSVMAACNCSRRCSRGPSSSTSSGAPAAGMTSNRPPR